MILQLFSRRGLRGKRWYFRGKSSVNGKTVFQSEGYHNHSDAYDTVRMLIAQAPLAKVDDSEYEAGR